MGPFEVLKRVRHTAYELYLAEKVRFVDNIFHVIFFLYPYIPGGPQ